MYHYCIKSTEPCEVRPWCGVHFNVTLCEQAEERPSALLTPDTEPDLCLTPEQREAKLRRVERIRERVIRRSDFFKPLLYLTASMHAASLCGLSTNWLFDLSISAVRERATTRDPVAIRGEGQEVHQVPPDTAGKQRMRSGMCLQSQTQLSNDYD